MSAGKLRRLCFNIRSHSNLFKIFHCNFLCFLSIPFKNRNLTGDAIFKGGHVVEKVKRLKNHSNLCPVSRKLYIAGNDVVSVIKDLALCWGFKKINATKHCAFSRTGSTDNAEHLALFNAEVNSPEDAVFAELLFKSDEFNYFFSHDYASST